MKTKPQDCLPGIPYHHCDRQLHSGYFSFRFDCRCTEEITFILTLTEEREVTFSALPIRDTCFLQEPDNTKNKIGRLIFSSWQGLSYYKNKCCVLIKKYSSLKPLIDLAFIPTALNLKNYFSAHNSWILQVEYSRGSVSLFEIPSCRFSALVILLNKHYSSRLL